jgi:pimeloyl-ACP methyl ester carboxylesterase
MNMKRRPFPVTRVIALLLAAATLLGLAVVGFGSRAAPVTVRPGAHAGQLLLHPCTYATEGGALQADCGTLTVPENRASPRPRLIALPVIRIRTRSPHPLAPIFRLNGGPGLTNMKFTEASRLTGQHDVVLVGYRGVDGSSVLSCPEVTAALRHSADLLSTQTAAAYSQAFAACARRLEHSGVDLAGYSLAEQADDQEAARTALGYGQIDLISESAGTRLAQVYMWRYPASVGRSVMIGVNPPGNFLYNGTTIDQQIEEYSAFCDQDPGCRTRTGNLAATVRDMAAHLPSRWMFLPVKPGNVRLATFMGLVYAVAGAPLTGPNTMDSWLSAAAGDPSGLWLMSLVSDLIFPTSFTWGEAAAVTRADAQAAEQYYASGKNRGSIIGNPLTDFLWGDGGLTRAWPASPGEDEYATPRRSTVPTLLIGGTVDFQTPAQNATRELLPYLPNGHQVVLSDLGHVADFWKYEPAAGTKMLTTFYATGRVNTSGYSHHTISFSTGTGVTQTTIAKVFLAVMLGFSVLAVVLLAWAGLRVRRRGAAGGKTSVALRTVLAVVIGLGGWFLGGLIVLTFLPSVSLSDELLAVLAVGVPVAIGLYLAWTRRDRERATKAAGILAVGAGALLGGWLGFATASGVLALLTTVIGATAGGNVALLVLEFGRAGRKEVARSPRQAVESFTEGAG